MALANTYLGWFAVDCHFTPDEVYETGWAALVTLTLRGDAEIERRNREAEQRP